jgi:hypothetical protein
VPALQGAFSFVAEQPPAAALLRETGLPQGKQNCRPSQVVQAKPVLLSGSGKRRTGPGMAENESGLLEKTRRVQSTAGASAIAIT